MIVPGRHTQPYRKGIRPQGGTLGAMLKGRDAQGRNPSDARRAVQKHGRHGKHRGRSALYDAMNAAMR